MSYILDALKKSEEKRRQEQQGPALLKPPSVSQDIRKKRPRYTIFSYIIILCILLLSGSYLYTRNNTIVQPPPPPPPQNTAKAAQQPAKDSAAKITKEVIPELRSNSKKAIASTKKEIPAEVLQPEPIVAEIPAPSAPPPSPSVDKPPYLSELPAAFKSSVPELKLAGHVYSPDPALRMILINNSIVRENDVVEKFFILEKITASGVILRRDSTKFRIDAN